MERVTDLTQIVRDEVEDYEGPAFKSRTFFVEDEKRQIYSVIIIPDFDYPVTESSGVVVMARIIEDKVVIEADMTDRPLYQELIRAGIPREHIILAYAGEPVPDAPGDDV